MSTRSDFCCYFTFLKEKENEFKNHILTYIINNLGDDDGYNLFENFFEMVNPSNDRIGFCLFEECIKFSYIQLHIDKLLNFFDIIKEEVQLKYEAKELCTEYMDFDSECDRSSDDDYRELYIDCRIGGIPETNDIILLNWIKLKSEIIKSIN
jgi:hypothetical protein